MDSQGVNGDSGNGNGGLPPYNECQVIGVCSASAQPQSQTTDATSRIEESRRTTDAASRIGEYRRTSDAASRLEEYRRISDGLSRVEELRRTVNARRRLQDVEGGNNADRGNGCLRHLNGWNVVDVIINGGSVIYAASILLLMLIVSDKGVTEGVVGLVFLVALEVLANYSLMVGIYNYKNKLVPAILFFWKGFEISYLILKEWKYGGDFDIGDDDGLKLITGFFLLCIYPLSGLILQPSSR